MLLYRARNPANKQFRINCTTRRASRNQLKNNDVNRSEHFIADLKISVNGSLREVKAQWQSLERHALGSYFQSYQWCESWLEIFGDKNKVTPVIVIATSATGKIEFILPMQIRMRFGLRVLEWLCQPENNYGCGIFNIHDSKKDYHTWLNINFAAVLATLPAYDVAALENMPMSLLDKPNPLNAINRFASADQSFFTKLIPDYNALHEAKRTSKSISKIRRRDERLSEFGALELEISNIHSDSSVALHEIIHHKTAQLTELGVRSFQTENIATFFDTILKNNSPTTSLHVFRLVQSGQTISGLIGAHYADTFWLMILTMAPGGPTQFSPGDYVLRKSIAWACENGLKNYDFGVGYSNYKEHWADTELQLYNYYAAKTLRGLPLAAMLMFYNAAKRLVKNTPALKSFFFQLRKALRGKKVA
jgi:CelD/BcsL family acetyltransferase involved in cellulose biosynthesis